jgi:hypothetical protein
MPGDANRDTIMAVALFVMIAIVREPNSKR